MGIVSYVDLMLRVSEVHTSELDGGELDRLCLQLVDALADLGAGMRKYSVQCLHMCYVHNRARPRFCTITTYSESGASNQHPIYAGVHRRSAHIFA